MAAIIIGIFTIVQKIFCSGNQQGPQQGNQQQGWQQQQQQQYPTGYVNNQHSAYPPLQQPQPTYQQQQGHGNAWQQQHHQPQHGGSGLGHPALGPHAPMNQDMINATNEQYVSLRNQARQLGDQAHQCFEQSQQAYKSGDGGRAHELSQQGKDLMAQKERLDDQADQWIFTQNNKDSPPGTVDLHGLYVKEALERTDQAIAQAKAEGRDELRVIVGKGIHSQDHVAKIKPAVEELMRKYNLSAHLDPHNAGVLIVDLEGREFGGRTRDAGAIVGDMSGKMDDGCTIM